MKAIFVAILCAGMIFATAGCANLETAGHKYLMKGQILETSGNSVYLCIGSQDGAQVGQEFSVYKFQRMPGPPQRVAFKREKTGTVKITEIADDHYARATVTEGSAKENYMVELNR